MIVFHPLRRASALYYSKGFIKIHFTVDSERTGMRSWFTVSNKMNQFALIQRRQR